VDLSDVGGREGGGTDMSGFQGFFCFGGLPPLAPFARAAAAFARLLDCPPRRPRRRATAPKSMSAATSTSASGSTRTAFLRGMGLVPAVDVLLRQWLDAFHRQGGDLARQFVEARDVSGFQRGVAFGHQVAAVRVHARNLPNRLGFVKWGIC
jgi:hypothetical protein